jgi:hypothetical protein
VEQKTVVFKLAPLGNPQLLPRHSSQVLKGMEDRAEYTTPQPGQIVSILSEIEASRSVWLSLSNVLKIQLSLQHLQDRIVTSQASAAAHVVN